jgi:segregation and condensation protein B
MDEQLQNYKSAIEAILFVSEKPVVLDQLKDVLPELKPSQIHDLIKQIQDEYVNRNSGLVVVEIAGGFQMLSNSQAAPYIREFYKTKTKEKLSRPALESLAIIAYKQPVGRAEVEIIRGVNSDGTIAHLLNKGLIKITGRKEVPGRPFLYGTTKEFLEYFGLKSLEDMPKMEEFAQLGVDMPTASTIADAAASLAPKTEAVELTTGREGSLTEAMEQIQREEASQESSGQSRVKSEEES